MAKKERSVLSKVGQWWLQLISLGLLLVGAGGIAIGSDIFISSKDHDSQSQVGSITLAANARDIAICLLIYASFLTLTSVFGLIGSCCWRGKGFLVCFIVSVIINVLFIIASSSYAIWKSLSTRAAINSVTVDQWRKASDDERDFIQQAFHCCGFDSNDGTAYKGPTSFPQNGTNQCSAQDISGIAGCHDQSYQFFTRTAIALGLFMGFATLATVLTLFAAYSASKNQAAKGLRRRTSVMPRHHSHNHSDPSSTPPDVRNPLLYGPAGHQVSPTPGYLPGHDVKNPLMGTPTMDKPGSSPFSAHEY